MIMECTLNAIIMGLKNQDFVKISCFWYTLKVKMYVVKCLGLVI